MEQAAIYNRVSSEKQREDETIEDQLDKNRANCKKNNSKIYKEYTDDGWTGATLRRPALTQLREDAKKGLFSELYLTNLSRLARKASKQAVVIEELRKNNIKVFVAGKLLENTPEGEFLINVLGAAHQLQKEMIIENTSSGKWRKARNGKLIQGDVPYGFAFKRNPDGSFVRAKDGGKIVIIDKKEAEIVRLIFDLYLKLQSPYFVAKELYKRKLKTRFGKNFAHSYIRSILQNEAYIGKWWFGKWEAVEPKKRKTEYIKLEKSSMKMRDKSQWIPFKIPDIIDEETFYQAQEIFKRKRKVKHKLNKQYMLHRILYCSCGAKMYGKRQFGYQRKGSDKRPEYFYYDCARKTKPFGQIKCNAKSVRIEKLDESVWNKIIELFNQPKKVFQYAKYLNDKENNVNILQRERDNLIKRKDFIKESKLKILELYEIGDIDKSLLSERMKHHEDQEAEIESRLKNVEIALGQTYKKEAILKEAEAIAGRIGEELKNFTLQQKIDFLNKFVERINYNTATQEIEMIGNFPVLESLPTPNIIPDNELALKSSRKLSKIK